MRISIESNIAQVISVFPMMEERIERETAFTMFRALSLVKAQILQNLRVNSGLNVKTGALFNSIRDEIVREGNVVIGKVYSTGVPYAQTHEYGRVVPGHTIFPSKGSALAWPGAGGIIFSKKNFIPTYTIPARPFMRPALESKKEEIYKRFGLIVNNLL